MRAALEAFIDRKKSHFGVYDMSICINDLEVLLEENCQFKCAFCEYPDENANGKNWRCSICGSKDSERSEE